MLAFEKVWADLSSLLVVTPSLSAITVLDRLSKRTESWAPVRAVCRHQTVLHFSRDEREDTAFLWQFCSSTSSAHVWAGSRNRGESSCCILLNRRTRSNQLVHRQLLKDRMSAHHQDAEGCLPGAAGADSCRLVHPCHHQSAPAGSTALRSTKASWSSHVTR